MVTSPYASTLPVAFGDARTTLTLHVASHICGRHVYPSRDQSAQSFPVFTALSPPNQNAHVTGKAGTEARVLVCVLISICKWNSVVADSNHSTRCG